MIIKGGSRSNGGFFAKHLTNDRDEKGNDRAELKEMRGVTAETVDGFFRETAAVASGTNCKNFFYHANLNPELSDQLSPAQWTAAVDMLEKNLGLEGQPRFVIEHEKEGRTHQHVVWSRIDTDTMTARDDSLTYRIHERTSREIEDRFDLVRGHSVLEAGRETVRPERRPQDWEGFRAQKTGIDLAEIKAEMTELWRTTDSGQAFAAAIADHGYVLARGDRRDFVLIDHAGDDHSLARRLEGIKAADVRERMADVDRNALPSVAEARTAQQERFSRDGSFDRAAALSAWENRGYGGHQDQARPEPQPQRDQPRDEKPTQELGRDAGNIRLAWSLTESGPGFAAAMQDRGYILAEVSAEEARASERAQAFAKEIGRFNSTLKEGELVAVNGFGRVARINERTTGDTAEGIDKHLAGIDRRALMNVTDAQDVMKEVSRQQFYAERQTARPMTGIEETISAALEKQRSLAPFSVQMEQAGLTIARATAADIEQLTVEHGERQAKIDEWLRRDPPRMNEGDLFAITRNDKAIQLNPFKLDFQQIEQQLSNEGQRIGSVAEVRAGHQEVRDERAAALAQRQAETLLAWETRRDAGAPDGRMAAEDRNQSSGLRVMDGVGDVLCSLADFIGDLFAGGQSEPPKPNRYDYLAQLDAIDRAEMAIENLRASMERGDTLRGEDIRNLTPEHLKSIAMHGDDAMRAIINREDEDREPDRSYGRER